MLRSLPQAFRNAGLLTFLSTCLMYADQPDQEYDIVHFSLVSAGASRAVTGELSEFLRQRGFGSFGTWAANFGLGSQVFVQRLELANELRFILWEDAVAGNTRTSLWSGSLHFDLGIDFLPPEGAWRLYPYLSAGGALVRLHQRDNRLPFDAALAQGPVYDLSVWQGTFLFGAGVGVSRVFSPGRMVYTMGVRVGYQADPVADESWISQGTTISAGPRIRMAGPYVQAIVGFGRNPRYGLRHLWNSGHE